MSLSRPHGTAGASSRAAMVVATGGLVSLASAGTVLLVLTGTSAVMPGRDVTSLPALGGRPDGGVVVVPEAPRSTDGVTGTRPVRGGSTGSAGVPRTAVRIVFPGPLTGVVPGSSLPGSPPPPNAVPGLGGQPALPGVPGEGSLAPDLPVIDLPVIDLPVIDLPVIDLPVIDLPAAGPVIRPRAPLPALPGAGDDRDDARDDDRADRGDRQRAEHQAARAAKAAAAAERDRTKYADQAAERALKVRAALRAQQAAYDKQSAKVAADKAAAEPAAEKAQRMAERLERVRAALRADQARDDRRSEQRERRDERKAGHR